MPKIKKLAFLERPSVCATGAWPSLTRNVTRLLVWSRQFPNVTLASWTLRMTSWFWKTWASLDSKSTPMVHTCLTWTTAGWCFGGWPIFMPCPCSSRETPSKLFSTCSLSLSTHPPSGRSSSPGRPSSSESCASTFRPLRPEAPAPWPPVYSSTWQHPQARTRQKKKLTGIAGPTCPCQAKELCTTNVIVRQILSWNIMTIVRKRMSHDCPEIEIGLISMYNVYRRIFQTSSSRASI